MHRSSFPPQDWATEHRGAHPQPESALEARMNPWTLDFFVITISFLRKGFILLRLELLISRCQGPTSEAALAQKPPDPVIWPRPLFCSLNHGVLDFGRKRTSWSRLPAYPLSGLEFLRSPFKRASCARRV